MKELVNDFLSILSDRQFIVFCLYYGYNELGLSLTLTELADFLKSKPSTISQCLDTITHKLSMPCFKELVEELANYE